MMGGPLESLILLAMLALLLILRIDAARFGAAEYEDEEEPGWQPWARRLSWYALCLLLIVVVYFLHPQPLSILHLQMGEPRLLSFVGGLGLAAAGIVFAFLYAWWRFGELRLPPAARYPAGVLNSSATAFIDEATFRGILLGLLLASNWPVELAIAFQAVLYALSTRLAATGRPRGMLVLSLAIGLVGGWLTVQTMGVGAAFLGHALTRFAVFLTTGHAGALRASGSDEVEVFDDMAGLPAGWEIVDEDAPTYPAGPGAPVTRPLPEIEAGGPGQRA